jgi:hypothetical protein
MCHSNSGIGNACYFLTKDMGHHHISPLGHKKQTVDFDIFG